MSEFSSTLGELDGRLKAVRAQMDLLRAALELDDGQLGQDLTCARQQGAMLRDLIRVERPDASWTDRRELDQLLLDLEAAAEARRNQARSNRLLELAGELEAGNVRHRFEARASALNALRLEAINELRTEAARDQVKELPGPGAVEWLPWVCNLQEDEEQTAALLAQLADFPALEHFAGEMEESYWSSPHIIAKPAPEPPPPEPPPPVATPQAIPASPAPLATAGNNHGTLPQELRPQFDHAMSNGNYAEALSLWHDNRIPESPAQPDTAWPPSAATEPPTSTFTAVASSSRAPAASVVRLKYCEKCGASYSSDFHECQHDDPFRPPAEESESHPRTRGIHLVLEKANERNNGTAMASGEAPPSGLRTAMMDSPAPAALGFSDEATSEAAGAEFERLRAIVSSKVEGEDPALVEEEEEDDAGKRTFILRVLGAVAIMVIVLVVVSFFFTARLGPKSDKPVTQAVKLSSQGRDSYIQQDIERRLGTLKGDIIQVTVHDGDATLAGQAATSADAARAAALAAQADGVKAITNNIRVDATLAKSPTDNSPKQ